MSTALSVHELWKSYRLYHERNQYLKAAILKGRRARYEEFWALKGIDFAVPTGSTFGVIGSNGSGKSTLLKTMAGILQPEKGSVEIKGRVSALLELGAGFHPELTGRENVFLNGAILGLSKKEITARFDDIVEFAGLPDFIDTPVKNYSSGMFVRLGFAVAAHVEPDVLLIDEVLSVGDESFQRRCAEKIDEFRRDGRTIVFVSHGLSQVEQLCEDAAWIDKGELKMLGKSAEVISAYQGQSHQAERVEGEQGSRWGSGEAQIVHVELRDADGSRPAVLTTHEPVTIHVDMTAHTPLQDTVRRRPDRQSRRRRGVGDEHPSQRPDDRADRRAGERRHRHRQPAAARRRLRPDRGAHRPHRGPSVRPLGTARPLRGAAVQVVRHRTREHSRRMDDHRRTRRRAERVVSRRHRE